jgi:hypothetical protein
VTARPTLHAENGGLFEVRRILPRPGGAVDLVIVFKVRGRKPAFSAYRREVDGRWKALHGAWTDADEAVAAVPHADRYSPVVYDPLIRFLSKAVNGGIPVGEGPDIGHAAEREYRASQDDYTDTPSDTPEDSP